MSGNAYEQVLRELCRPAPRAANPNRPTVSFLCPTYGRCWKQPEVLGECVHWFTRQVYPNCEMVILNDAPGQTLVCDVPRVRCVNWPERIPNLGDKMNVLVSLAAGAVCVPYEDDDIVLPHRAAQAVAMLRGYEWWSPMLWWYCQRGRPPVADGNGNGYTSSAFRRDAMLGNHPPEVVAHDAHAADWARQNLRCNPQTLSDPSGASYCYRWGVSGMHLSGCKDPLAAFHANDPGRPGTYHVSPRAGATDWAAETAAIATSSVR